MFGGAATSTIPSSYSGGEIPSVANWNAAGLALKALGITDDNDGDPMTARSGLYPFSFRGGDSALAGKQIDGSSYTVIAGQMAVVDIVHIGGGNDSTVTPSGGAAIIFASDIGSLAPSKVGIVLGAGDQIAMASTCRAGMNIFTAPSDATRVLQAVTSASTYTVAAGKVLYLTHASSVGEALTAISELLIDSVIMNVPNVAGFGATPVPVDCRQTRVLKAGQVVGASAGDTILISGILVNA